MKTSSLLLTITLLISWLLSAQPPGSPDMPANTIPKKDILKPQNPKLTPITFVDILNDASWKGVRTWYTPNGATLDSITAISFFLPSKQVFWTKQGWETVSPNPGTYLVTGNRIIIQFNYPPYTHYLEGTYDASTKKITGTFREDRAVMRNPPTAYQPGNNSGNFVIVQK